MLASMSDIDPRADAPVLPATAAMGRTHYAQAALAGGDLIAAGRWADDAAATATGWWLISALTTRARVAIAQGEPEQAERDAHDALARAAEVQAYLDIPDILECLGTLAVDAGSAREAARLFGAAHGIRRRMGAVRFKVWDAGYEASVAAVRDALGEEDFDSAWAEGAALSTEGTIAARGAGDRLRAARPRRTQTTRQRLGISYPHRGRRRATGQRRTRQQGHRDTAVRLTAHGANPPDPRLHETRPHQPCSSCKRPPATRNPRVGDTQTE